jgi:hypothetical protein
LLSCLTIRQADALTGGLERSYRIVNIARNSESVLMINGNVNGPVYVTREDPMYGEVCT